MSAKKRLKYIVIFFIGIGILFSFLMNYYASMNFVFSQLESRAIADINKIVSDAKIQGNFDFIDLYDYNNYKVEVIDSSYRLIQSNREDKASFFSSDVFAAKKDGSAIAFQREKINLPMEFIYSKKVNIFDQDVVIRCTYFVKEFDSYKKKIINIVIVFIVLLISFIYLLVKSIKTQYKTPLKKLAKYTSKVGPSAKDKIRIDTNDSTIIKIVDEFNNLIDSYNDLIDHNNKKISTINSFLSNLNTGIITFDSAGEVLLMNNKVEYFLDIKKSEVFLTDNLSNKYFSKLKEFVNEISDQRESIIFDLKLDNNNIVEIEGRAFYNKYSPFEFLGVVFMIRDVTKFKELETVQREFVSNVSHELKTPLSVISGYTQTLINDDGLLDREMRDRCLNSIYKESERLSYLITELLEISRVSEDRGFGENEIFNPFKIVNKSLVSIRDRAKRKNIIIVTNVSTYDEIYINNKPLFFLQILNNLLDNAIKYSPVDSKISIKQSVVNNTYILQVSDRGYGIPKKDLEFIFDRFYRVEKSRNSEIAGSGLGLAITKDMVNKLGGTIEVESCINKGSTFSVSIPL